MPDKVIKSAKEIVEDSLKAERLPYEGTYTIEDTSIKMLSPDYRDRFVAEYVQLKYRYERLKHMLTKWEAFGMQRVMEKHCAVTEEQEDYEFAIWMGFKPKCSFGLLRDQQSQMGALLHTLELRAEIEGIDLRKVTIKL